MGDIYIMINLSVDSPVVVHDGVESVRDMINLSVDPPVVVQMVFSLSET